MTATHKQEDEGAENSVDIEHALQERLMVELLDDGGGACFPGLQAVVTELCAIQKVSIAAPG